MNRYLLVWIGTALLLITACSKRSLSFKDAEVVEDFAIDNVDFQYFSTSSKIKFENEDRNLSATANIRLKKDSIIWVSLTPGFGIEAARGIITQDSIIFINRIDKAYSAYNFEELSQKFNFDIDFNLLQSVILGNMPVNPDENDLVRKESGFFVVRQEKGPVTINNYVNARSLKLERVAMLDQSRERGEKRNNTLMLRYDNFQQLEDQIFPFENFVSLNYRQNGEQRRTEVDIQHKKASITNDALRFPFSVPEKYEQK